MSIWAIVPVKPFLQSKTRLASKLSPEERAGLSREFLTQTLGVLTLVRAITQIVVISRDPCALAVAQQSGAMALTEPDHSNMNAALTYATRVAVAGGAGAVLALPTDLPLLSGEAVAELIETDADPAVRIAPDRHATGTNALFVRPPGLIPYAFGAGSFQRHQALAARAGVSARLCHVPAMALDIDTPTDLHFLQMTQKI